MTQFYNKDGITIHCGDALEVLRELPDESVNCCVTSPPYWGLRDYGKPEQLGLERTPGEYVSKLHSIFSEVRRVLMDDGTLWLNLGDSYASDSKGTGGASDKQLSNSGSRYSERKLDHGVKVKDLVGTPWKVAFALQESGWYLRQDIIWSKPNGMPESVTDRCSKSHEYIFLLAKSERYYFDHDAVKIEPKPDTDARYDRGRSNGHKYVDGGPGDQTIARSLEHMRGGQMVNRRSVWTVAIDGYPGAHFATFPPNLIKPCILAGCPAGGIVLDPFLGSGTTAMVARDLSCGCVGIDLNADYCAMAAKRLAQGVLPLA